MISNDLWLLIAGSTLLAAECAPSLIVHHDYDRAADFARLETFDWVRSWHRRSPADLHDSNPFLDSRIRQAIEAELLEHGLRKARGTAPDMLVAYYAATDAMIDADTVGEFEMAWSNSTGTRSVRLYEPGTLVIDMADARTRRAIWRGWGRGAFGHGTNAAREDESLRQAVDMILAAFPPFA